ncbi:twin-arginine translocation signal domain-containing protein, partial [Pseudoxanthomonas sp.]|uniref:twin-arginine translocation signal domain-containing protein n=1 Tax=Pseudoxanthomonas sp. TaxID=1871049 RepID=UPI0025CFA177
MKHDDSGRLGAFRPTRRQFVTGLASGSAALGFGLVRLPASAGTPARRGGAPLVTGTDFALSIGAMPVDITGRTRPAITVNDSADMSGCNTGLLVVIDDVQYLFNAPDGFQRIAGCQKLSFGKVRYVFLSSLRP